MIDTSQFTGGDELYRHGLARGYRYTEGVQFVAEQAKAYWLLDVIFSWQIHRKVRAEEFQVWTLRRMGERGALVTMTDGNTKKAIATQEVPLTDFPFAEFDGEHMVMWLANHTLYLPSEH